MHTHTLETEARNHILKALLLQHHGRDISWETSIDAIERIFGETIKQTSLEVNVRMLKAEAWPDPGWKIEMNKRGFALRKLDRTQVGVRSEIQREIKKRLGRVLWSLLFGEKNFANLPCRLQPSNDLEVNLGLLRGKHAPACWIDAGSTMLLAVHQLLGAKSFPILAPDLIGEHDIAVRPLVVTNSYEIAAAVGASRHHLDLRVRMVGGELKMDLKSVSGLLTDRCLAAWQMRGDVAILGATGIRDDESPLAFCCDDLEEADLKTSFLRACWFRVVVADSSKIGRKGKTTATHSFATISRESLDLVVLDDGNETGKTEEVNRFLERARGKGVACLILQTNPPDRLEPKGKRKGKS